MEALKTGQPTIPVTWVDLDEAEESLILATFDPLAAMAGTDAAQLDSLLRDVSTGDAAVMELLAGLQDGVGLPTDDSWGDAFDALPDGDRAPFQQMTFTLSDAQAEVVTQALKAAQAEPFADTGNANSNGNALARICEAYGG